MIDKQNLYSEINHHLLSDQKPSEYFNEISKIPLFNEYPFQMLNKLKLTEQSPVHHPEGNVWNHTMLVVDVAARLKRRSVNVSVFMWAALLHDIGKPDTTKLRKGRITSYDHDKKGYELSKKFLTVFTDDHAFIEKVSLLIRWHMQILFVVNNLPFANIEKMKHDVNIQEVALLGLCDRLGRTNVDHRKEEQNIQQFIDKCNRYSLTELKK